MDRGVVPVLQVDFDITDENASELEVVCSIKGLTGMSVSGVTIAEREQAVPSQSKWSRLRFALPRAARNGNGLRHAK